MLASTELSVKPKACIDRGIVHRPVRVRLRVGNIGSLDRQGECGPSETGKLTKDRGERRRAAVRCALAQPLAHVGVAVGEVGVGAGLRAV